MLARLKLEVPVRGGCSVVDVFQVQAGKAGNKRAGATAIANGHEPVITCRVLRRHGLVVHELGGQLSPANLNRVFRHYLIDVFRTAKRCEPF